MTMTMTVAILRATHTILATRIGAMTMITTRFTSRIIAITTTTGRNNACLNHL
jgi:hypothetical protein